MRTRSPAPEAAAKTIWSMLRCGANEGMESRIEVMSATSSHILVEDSPKLEISRSV